jgi:glycosyltransferase involved in cell wall biosynthesis
LIVPTKNHEKFAPKFFKSLRKQKRKPDEMILVDGSTDRTPEIAKPYVDKLIKVKKYGASYQRSVGVKYATGDILVFTDIDTVLDKNWLKEIENMFLNPNVHVARGQVLWPEIQKEVPLIGKRINHCNVAYRRHVLEEFPFDPSVNRGDDWDMGYRVSKKYIIYGCPKAKVLHLSFEQHGWKNAKAYGKDWVTLMKKYKNPYWLIRAFYNVFYPLIEKKPKWALYNLYGLIVALIDEL